MMILIMYLIKNDKNGRLHVTGLVSAMLVLVALVLPVIAQENSNTKSGFEDVPQFGGPSSVGGNLREDDEVRKPWFGQTRYWAL